MVLTTRIADSNDAAAIADLWNARAAEANACMYGAQQSSQASVLAAMADSYAFALVEAGGQIVGFSFFRGPHLSAMCSSTAAIYYTAMAAWMTAAIAAGESVATCQIAARNCDEMGWMNAMGVVSLEAIGFAPLTPNDDPETPREVMAYLASADCVALKAAAESELESLQ